ncbi:MAG: dienelactone hydrolase family protein [Pseudomonadales bacterium]|nr:dienelactone hydrolase family protein [Pseudomonadales bacterium]
MAEMMRLEAADGFAFDGYCKKPESGKDIRGAVLVIQEVFGVNGHIREVCDGYAEQGYVALAPAIFDRVEKNVQLGYEGKDMMRGVEIAKGLLKPEQTMLDLNAGIEYLQQFGKVGVVGYCFGGLMSWLCAAEMEGVACVSAYYGGGVTAKIELTPKVPTILHFGDQDAHIPLPDVEKLIAVHPSVPVYIYAADHGFNCDHRASYDEAAAKLALQRTHALFAEHIG